MSLMLDAEIRIQLARLLRGEATLAEFQEWFAPVAWNLDDLPPATRDLVVTIETRLAEFLGSGRPEAVLHEGLFPLVTGYELLYLTEYCEHVVHADRRAEFEYSTLVNTIALTWTAEAR